MLDTVKKVLNGMVLVEDENISEYQLNIKSSQNINKIMIYKVVEFVKNSPIQDEITVEIIFNEDDIIKIIKKEESLNIEVKGPDSLVRKKDKNTESKIDEIIKQIRLDTIHQNYDEFELCIYIEKFFVDGNIRIYNEEVFIKWLIERNVLSIINTFNTLFERNNTIKLNTIGNDGLIFRTYSIGYNTSINNSPLKRKEKINHRKELSNVSGIDLKLLPEDFNISGVKGDSDETESYQNMLLKYIEMIKGILCLAYICDIVEFKENEMDIIITGYKKITDKINYLEVQDRIGIAYLYKIYDWIYNDGNLVDKASIARNVISLHCRYEKIYNIDENVINSILSNYKYYLIKNTEDFLEEKKALEMDIISESKEITGAINGLSDSLKKSILAYFGFIGALIITNSIGEGNFEMMTFEVVNLLGASIVFSYIYMIISVITVNGKKKEINLYVEDLKNTYAIYLGAKNVEEKVGSIKSFQKINKSFRFKRNCIIFLWFMINTLSLLLLDYLTDIKILGLINFIK